MAENLTPQQRQAVTDRGGKLLVSAAAGSGKTKVLVDRLMLYICDPIRPVNIDDFLIITFTEAAAAELRSKIATKLTEKIAEDPTNKHLQKQMQRLHLAKISTIHSFCSGILREHAYLTDLSVDFRLADEKESAELQMTAMDRTLESAYAGGDRNFYAFVDTQGLGRDDRSVPLIVLDIFEKSRCHPNPDDWLDSCVKSMDLDCMSDASETAWGKYLINDLHKYLDLQIEAMRACVSSAEKEPKSEKTVSVLSGNVDLLRDLRNREKWDEIVTGKNYSFGTLTFTKEFDPALKEQIKEVRDNCKKILERKLALFSEDNTRTIQDITATAEVVKGIVETVKKFANAYTRLKRSHRVVDFSDLEHSALDLLTGKGRSAPTQLADEIGKRFVEVMVDEYQDTNEVQERIFHALTYRRNNCFMVGDVKQSIYQFRLADPGIFIEKYNTYKDADFAEPGEGRKVLLSSNFRSSGGVIDAVNDVFSHCMSPDMGGLYYGAQEQLNEGLEHISLNEPEVELFCIQAEHDKYEEEANFTANKIRQMLDGRSMVRDQDGLRPVAASDIVILLRAPGSVGIHYQLALERQGIPCVMEKSADLLQTEEISVLRSVLQVISNPLQDIPLVAALTSRVFGFTADEIAEIRSSDRNTAMFHSIKSSDNPKAMAFLETLSSLRYAARTSTLSQLLDTVLVKTGIDRVYGAMPDGRDRIENIFAFAQLAASFEKNRQGDLERYLEYLNNLSQRKGLVLNDDSNSSAVQIMSIHKSKGLEFPVVFLCALSKGVNKEDLKEPVLCDKDLGLGLYCTDGENRVRYPNLARRAISAKMIAESFSEEMRVLYVAMTRARDRLIMTYTGTNMEKHLLSLVKKMDHCPAELMVLDAVSAGDWVLLTALQRAEAGELFAVAGRPENVITNQNPWSIRYVETFEAGEETKSVPFVQPQPLSDVATERIGQSLSFTYPHMQATSAPSKQTATQLKGRIKDLEIAEGTAEKTVWNFRRPSFVETKNDPKRFGNAMHAAMQYIRFDVCRDRDAVSREVDRLVNDGYILKEYGDILDIDGLTAFFQTDIGKKFAGSHDVLREFKFSILDDCERYIDNTPQEKILLQGVVDCLLIEKDGLTVIDFKTDHVTEDSLDEVACRYTSQVRLYAYAMERIFKKPVKDAYLYFFRLKRFHKV